MRLFVDTNIVVELLENRKESDNIDRIFEAIETRQWEKVLSVGSFYTLTFLIERIIRRQGIGNPACGKSCVKSYINFWNRLKL